MGLLDLTLRDGSIIVCDYSNNKVKHLDSSFTIKESFNLQSAPWDVSAVKKNTAIITLPDVKQVQYIEVIPILKTARTFQLNKTCWGVHVAGEEIYITAHDNTLRGYTGEVRVLDFAGNMIIRDEPRRIIYV